MEGPSHQQDLLAISNSLEKISLHGGQPDSDLIDTPAAVSTLVDALDGQPTTPPSLYMDLEGINLSRHGSISILQVFVLPSRQTYLVDIHTLGDKAFSTQGANGRTLREILESDATPKVFFDIRNDSDALYSHFHIKLAGIQDLQLMELATRTFSRKFVNGLAKCIERDSPLSTDERVAWKAVKEKGAKLFAPERGGTYQVFNERPLSEEIRLYCAQDVQFLPRLWSHYDAKLTKTWETRVREVSNDRVTLSQSSDYNGKGQHMALAPKGWAWL
ncbi:ribonuclease H-like domain-containing protein [Bombardia bombarda]|uniref:Ribonuclease H-like domain-containing protein n=1 Tax=Bombardia bombarda TaxID=252184 RepID=A0AA39U682_9PEZI|nr:ribonuclease H-like domain-containing protein [Bombardia bombarda]